MLQVGNRTIPSGSLADAIMQLGFHLAADNSAQFRQAAHQAQGRGEALREALLASGCSPLDMTAFHSFQDDINAAIVDAANTQRDADAIDWKALDVNDAISKTAECQDRDQELRRKIGALIDRADDIESDLRELTPATDDNGTGSDEADSFVPTPADRNILQALAEATTTLVQVDIEHASGEPIRTVKNRLPILEQAKVVNRPHGPRTGYAITDAGRQMLAQPGVR